MSLKKHKNAEGLNINNAISRNGALYCFCEEHISNESELLDKEFEFLYTDPVKGNPYNVSTTTAPICKEYYRYMTGFGYIL